MREPIFSRSKFGRLAFSEPTGKASIWTACPFAATTFSEASTMINPTSNPSSRTSFPPGPGGLRQDPKPHQADLRGPTDTGIPRNFRVRRETSICLLLWQTELKRQRRSLWRWNLSPHWGEEVEASLCLRDIASSSGFCQGPRLRTVRLCWNTHST
jgi:hypothetical protein